ncbi:enoyl-CoA delta isomerase 2, peroxisomal [Brachypodium distachyon]|uniref:Uncharacterized protein n=1 Tax=Brachypodium distachyon TaxID=15368 RepID=I1INK9_BRADI|nr:enoyl-CoA delta isomerase 2, peroxisomal [Brachypodium distachyon]KQJ89458.1 hypothetical protein BRADI_4g25850v3 [Brachypodium distachyon]|eukprot:XP_024319464.1 enoyl-CoA delta isomerase 2, peroxisomal [Brachypodium distachyon]
MESTFCSLEPARDGFFVLTMSSADGHQYLTEHAVADLVKTLTRVRDDPKARGLVTTCQAGNAVSFCDGINYADDDARQQAEAGDPGLTWRVATRLATAVSSSVLFPTVFQAERKADPAAGMAEVIRLLMELPMPTVAAVSGNATSLGVALALAHDSLVMWGRAELRLPETELRRRPLPDYAGKLLQEKLPSSELRKLHMSRPCIGDQLVSSCYYVQSANKDKGAVLNDALQLLYKRTGGKAADIAKARRTKCPKTCADLGITGPQQLPRPPISQSANAKPNMRRSQVTR